MEGKDEVGLERIKGRGGERMVREDRDGERRVVVRKRSFEDDNNKKDEFRITRNGNRENDLKIDKT